MKMPLRRMSDIGKYIEFEIVDEASIESSVTVNNLPLLSDLSQIDHEIVGVGNELRRIADRTAPLIEKIKEQDALTADHGTRIEALENKPAPPVEDTTPKKWYILPLAGQSNMTGFGEIMPNLPTPNPRLMQLGIHASGTEENVETVTLANTGYGDKFDLYRPYEDCNLKLIPTAPCLDSFHNLFYLEYAVTDDSDHRRAGGLVGVGHYLAEIILKNIPEDYGVLIVNVSRGSTGFGDENRLGTYDAVTMTPELSQGSTQSGGSRRWWGDGDDHNAPAPYGLALYDRIKYALDLNPENVLLPVVWFQGESDDDCVDHNERFKNLIRYVKRKIVEDNLEKHLPTKTIHDFRWLAFGSTKILLGSGMGLSYLGTEFDNSDSYDWSYLRAMYDNYAYLMSDPEFQNPQTKEPQIISVRCDLDSNGRFYETVKEELDVKGLSSIASSSPDWHFSTSHVMHEQPQLIAGIISRYGKCSVTSTPITKNRRPIRSLTGEVSTDGVVFEYSKRIDPYFKPTDDLILYHDYNTTNPSADATPTFISPVMTSTIIGDTPLGVVDPEMGTVLVLPSDANRRYKYSIVEGSPEIEDYTSSIVFKLDISQRNSTNKPCLLSCSSEDAPIVCIEKGALAIFSKYKMGDAEHNKQNLSLNKSYLGAWNGGFDSWQHLSVAYSKVTRYLHIYLNGCHVDSIRTINAIPDQTEFFVGGFDGGASSRMSCKIASVRLYSSCLTPEQNYSTYLLDFKDKKINLATP